ncbi:sensor histidine kinase, partial [Streptomyces sp. 8L]|uniref:sensor histidine kinase n=1 Tax=Streptomyces sp. 8L TaxID=2877242 RepID=UPI0035A91628
MPTHRRVKRDARDPEDTGNRGTRADRGNRAEGPGRGDRAPHPGERDATGGTHWARGTDRAGATGRAGDRAVRGDDRSAHPDDRSVRADDRQASADDRTARGGDRPPLAPRVRRRASGVLESWPFRRKLNAMVIVPIAAIAAMLAYVTYQQVDQAQSAASTARLVRSSRAVAELIDGLQTEHREALLLSLHYEARTNEAETPNTAGFRQAQEGVDAQARAVATAFGDELPPAEGEALKEIGGLSALRETIESGPLPPDNIDPAYSAAVDDLIDGLDLGSSADQSSTSSANVLDALLRADTAHASFETSVFAARTGDPNALIEFTGAVGEYATYTYQADRFTRYATTRQGQELAGIERSEPENTIGQHYAALQVDPGSLVAQKPSIVQDDLSTALSSETTYLRQADNRLRITRSLIGQIADEASGASNAAWWRAVILLGSALVGFVLWLLFSVLARRSVIRPVQALTAAATRVADLAGRELSRVADDDSVDTAPPRLEAVPVPVQDEIGDLAAAFNQVQATATALLERQVLGRRNVAEMFGNVGRRVSNLTVRQLTLIDAIERGETSPDVLERLYRIDHIAVRLQRNAESLLLLAGIRDDAPEAGPTALTDVVRAALGQIEGYQRVAPRAENDVTVIPDIVGDLTLMLAELLENAVAFSPSGTRVEVVVRSRAEGGDGDGGFVEIIDHGLGMSPARLEEENARLVRRERLDLVPTKVLGLFVVGGLSRRWGIRVTLARTPGGGTTASVLIPPSLLLAGPVPKVGPRALAAVPDRRAVGGAPPIAMTVPKTPRRDTGPGAGRGPARGAGPGAGMSPGSGTGPGGGPRTGMGAGAGAPGGPGAPPPPPPPAPPPPRAPPPPGAPP